MFTSKNIFNLIYSIGFVLCFFIMFVIYFKPNSAANIYVGFIFWAMTYILCLYAKPKQFVKFSLQIFNLSVVKILFLFLVYILITSLVHLFLGYYQGSALYYLPRIYKFLIAVFAVYFFPIFAIFIRKKFKAIIKLFYLTVYGIFILGLFQYFIFAFHLDFLNTFLFDIITNARFSLYTELAANMERLRIFSVFNEPGVLGKFIFLMMPLVFHLSYSKYKLLQNKSANFIIKKSFIPLMILVLIMTQSGFWVPICTAEFLFFIFRFNLINIRKNIFIFVPIIVFFLISIVYISVEYLLLQSFEDTSVVSRIFVVISHITSLDGLVKYEPSLAGRIITIIIQMKIFMKNIFFGIGFANVYCGAKTVIDSANIPVTLEILSSYYSMPGKMAGIGQSPIFTLLAETGIFGALFFIIFEITNIVSIYKISKKIEGLNKVFVTGLFECLICLFLLCFYTSYLDAIVFWLLFGLSLTVIYANKYNKFYIGEIKPIKYITNKNTSTEDNNE